MTLPLVSVVITNFNYAQYLAQAIDSALSQTYAPTEVLVIDDGSIDGSREIIARYAGRVRAVLQENRGMGATYNRALEHSRGDVVLLLDADDFLFPSAAAQAASALMHEGVSKVHWPLRVVDAAGRHTAEHVPHASLEHGDLLERLLREGPDAYLSPPTSGNAWARAFLERVLPMPEPEYRQHADSYLTTLAPVFGRIARVWEPQGCYRIHGCNDYACQPSDEKCRRNLQMYERRCSALELALQRRGLSPVRAAWISDNPRYRWLERFTTAAEQIKALVPPSAAYVLIDDASWGDQWGGSPVLGGRKHIPFLERDGQYWGPPPDDATAVSELERLRRAGADYLVIAWPSFWWLDHYPGLVRHVRERHRCLLDNELALVFDLSRARAVEASS